MFGLGRKAATGAQVPDGLRIYAIGDVHGRLDLLRALLTMVQADDAARGEAETHVVMLGDLIDRGPELAEIIDYFLAGPPPFAHYHFIMGNHEEMLLKQIYEPSEESLAHFLRFGGRETFESYGVPQRVLDMPERYSFAGLTDAVPARHRTFLSAMEDMVRFGDYLFVHAGIRPDVPIDEQKPSDLRWIRQQFLYSDVDHGVVVVHGHTITEEPELRPNRIGIDTGAFQSGRLTALGLEGRGKWLIVTGD
ncbi:metallophosphoesterase [Sphingomonas sp. MMS24-J13]|uniref:metallophosphoesterase n=1 Tax=Sphingomonas sp. MMS24-J13 TaxID=3238686 RepID=UPI00384C76F9